LRLLNGAAMGESCHAYMMPWLCYLAKKNRKIYSLDYQWPARPWDSIKDAKQFSLLSCYLGMIAARLA
jgi:hypothetical protein